MRVGAKKSFLASVGVSSTFEAKQVYVHVTDTSVRSTTTDDEVAFSCHEFVLRPNVESLPAFGRPPRPFAPRTTPGPRPGCVRAGQNKKWRVRIARVECHLKWNCKAIRDNENPGRSCVPPRV